MPFLLKHHSYLWHSQNVTFITQFVQFPNPNYEQQQWCSPCQTPLIKLYFEQTKVDLTWFPLRECKDSVTCRTNSEHNQLNWTFCKSASLKGHNLLQEVGSIEPGADISASHFTLVEEIACSHIPHSPAHWVNYLIGLEAVMASEGQ